jgi:hypothetical protein
MSNEAEAVELYSALAQLYREGHRVEIVTSDGQRIDPVFAPPFIGVSIVEEDHGKAISVSSSR